MMSERVFPPLGILSLATYCKHKGFNVVVHDNATANDVEKLSPADIFGLSCTTPQYTEALNIKKKIRHLYPESRIVIGGAHCSGFLQTCKNDNWDSIVIGEGEEAFYKLLQDYQKNRIQSVYQEPYLNIDTLPIPDRSFIDIGQYRYERDGKRFTTMMTSRGCPFSCAFCSSIWGKKYRYRKSELVKKEIDYLVDELKFDGIMFVDDVINDAVLSWRILKDGGILIFDDYGWGIHTTDEKQKPKLAIDAFMSAYQGHYQLLEAGWQVFLKKLHYEYSKEELEANYQ